MWQEALQWFTDDRIEAIMRAASLMAMGFVLAWLVSTGSPGRVGGCRPGPSLLGSEVVSPE